MMEGNVTQPMFCDRFCPHATFPEQDALDGACRREVTLWCTRFEQLVRKNDRCLALRRGREEGETAGS